MPRNYVRKRQSNYTEEDLKLAVDAVKTKRMTYKLAEKTFKVPQSVICSRISWRVTKKETLGAGRPNVFPTHVEEAFSSCMAARAEMGYPVDKKELFDLIQQYVQQKKLKTPFKDNRPGEEWYRNFMKRSSVLSLKKT